MSTDEFRLVDLATHDEHQQCWRFQQHLLDVLQSLLIVLTSGGSNAAGGISNQLLHELFAQDGVHVHDHTIDARKYEASFVLTETCQVHCYLLTHRGQDKLRVIAAEQNLRDAVGIEEMIFLGHLVHQ